MKNSIRILAMSLVVASAAHAAPFLAVGDSAELFLTGTLGVQADDNIFLSQNKVSDTIFIVNPGIDYSFGKGSVTQGHFSYVENISRYSQHSALDTALGNLNFSSNYDDGKNKVNAVAGYNQLNQNTVDVRSAATLARRDVTNASLNGEFSATAKSEVGIGANYNNTNYKLAGYSDLTTFEVPLTYYYAMTSKVDMSAGVKYRTSDVKNGVGSKDYSYLVGARGEFTPNVTGSVMVGLGERKYDNGLSSNNLFSLDGSLNIALTPKSNLQLTASNDFGTSGAGQDEKNLSLGAIVSSQVSDQVTLRGGLSYRAIDYYTRTDDYTELQLGADYAINKVVSINGSYAHRNNSSVLAGASFTENLFSLSANFRY